MNTHTYRENLVHRSLRKIMALVLTLAMLFGIMPMFATSALAASSGSTIDVSDDTTASGDGWTYSGGVFTVTGDVTITGTTTTNRVKVQSGASVSIILDNADIQLTGANNCAFDMTGAIVNLTLEGSNTLTSGDSRAGLQVPAGATIVIDGAGTLYANGGVDGTGIGGVNAQNGGNITITGGIIIASGGYHAAGIGGGVLSTGGNIVITGGIITATGGDNTHPYYGGGAGIGGGGGSGTVNSGASGSITITGGTVTATGGGSNTQGGGAGIGSGGSGEAHSAGDTGDSANPITITVPVTATGGAGISGRNGAGIGHGGGRYDAGAAITPDTTVTTYIITASASTGGSISPSGNVSVVAGANQVFTVTANADYVINTVTVDSASQVVTNANSFTFVVPNVTSARNVAAAFTRINAEMPSITVQPQNASYSQGGAATPLTVTAGVTDGGTLSYQWYQNTVSTTTGGSAVGTNSASYTPSTGIVGTLYYFCVITNTNTGVSGAQTATATSNVATVTVNNSSSSGGGSSTTRYTVSFNTNGGGTVSSQSVTSGGKVTKPADPVKGGYIFAGWYTDVALKTAYDFSRTVTSAFILYAKWTLPFKDVVEGAWYYTAVEDVYGRGLMIGTEEDMFGPDLTLTRAMIVTILYRNAGEPDVSGLTNPFTDAAEGEWYSDAIKWAAANNIVQGYGNGIVGINDPVTKEQLAVLLYRTQQSGGKTAANVGGASIPDADKVSVWAAEAVDALSAQGIFSDIPGANFNPQAPATRAEVASMLHRFLELVY